MREGRPSTTALYVAMGRAIAHADARASGFSDPIARELLPDDARRLVDLHASGQRPPRLRDRWTLRIARRVSRMMTLRTLAIDDAIRSAPERGQLVILGAGLDARAWRMDELRETVVFEVDHPATQAAKRERTAALRPLAREVRFVPVDFQRDSLEAALERAGQDATRPTLWLWEGVIRYLSPEAIEATLDAIASRSAPGSRLVANYTTRAGGARWLSNLVLRAIGEPIRSSISPEGFAALLATRGFAVISDTDATTLAARASVPSGGLDRWRWAGIRHILVAARS
ncbi:MAG TPA: class I SAM-dependent methyltransferase [Myxococcota bacterium]|nr:class I SAM-dependent methyltransferase [Myxococcota bacterium]